MPEEPAFHSFESLLQRPRSRRSLFTGGLRLAGMSALAAGAWPILSRLAVEAQDFKGDVDVLNYALTLEHLEFAFYRDGVQALSFGSGPFGESIADNFAMFRDHEAAHVRTLTDTIKQLGGTPVAEATYDFGYGTDPQKFLATARALENTGVMAYDGAASSLTTADLLTAAGTIVAVEARHAAYLDLLSGMVPFPAPFETPAARADVLKAIGPFIVGSATPSAGG
jgi:rubrerythrin